MKHGEIHTRVVFSLCIIIQKKAIRICGNVDSRSHTRPLFYQWKTLGIYDIVKFNVQHDVYVQSVGYANLLPANLLSFF